MVRKVSELFVRSRTPSRAFLALLVWAAILIGSCAHSRAQDDTAEVPLGDVARSLRKQPAASETVVDNDNLSQVVDDAESRRAAGSSPVFTLDAGGKKFHISSPDVTCSLSFSAKTASLLSDPVVLNELPRSELAKLDGPATLDGDSLQVLMHNGTAWELREIVIGLTIVNPRDAHASANYGQARIVPAVAGTAEPLPNLAQKRADVTLLLPMKGSAAPSAAAIFRIPLNFALFPDQEWHWAIVKARGIPPQTPVDMTAQPEGNGLPSPEARGANMQTAPPSSSHLPN